MGLSLKLTFIGPDSPQLERVEFSHPSQKALFLSVRGKTAGGYTQTNRTFQWTSAVQGLSLLFLKGALFAHSDRDSRVSNLTPSLEGGKGSIVASIDYSLDKQPAWLLDMFGTLSDGRSCVRSLLRRSNPGLKRASAACISLNNEMLTPGTIKTAWNGRDLTTFTELLELYRALEKSCGALRLSDVAKESGASDIPVIKPLRIAEPEKPPSPQAYSRFKTPFVRQGTPEGDVFTRVYERNGDLALVTIFAPLEYLDFNREVSVRIHSSCIPSDVLGAIDCDCHSQLHRSTRILRGEKGVLIHLFQEGRGAGLYSKYLGMSLASQHGLDTYEAYRRLSIKSDSRSYELAAMVLEDLGIKRISLLSNNPAKVEGLSKFGFIVTQRDCKGAMSPQNLSYLFDKMTKGGHLLQDMFKPDSLEFFLCESAAPRENFQRVWIFGGDDTLWEDNVVYEDIIRQFVDYICQWIPTLPRHCVREVLDQVETEFIPTHGFGAPGFLQSMKEAFRRLSAEHAVSIRTPQEIFDSVIPRLSGIATSISHRTIEVIEKLRDMNHGLVLCTQGPLEIQLRKIAQSRLGGYFHAICVVPRKSQATLSRLRSSLSFSGQEYVVIGSSIQSDILPARELGMEAVHFRNPNSWQLINRQEAPLPEVREITALTELLTPIVSLGNVAIGGR